MNTPRDEVITSFDDWATGSRREGGRVYLIVVGEGSAERIVDIAIGQSLTIGRNSGDIQVTDARISRQHARVARSASGLTLEDLGSRNGTLVNGEVQRGTTCPLRAGDVIRLGNTEIVVAIVGSATAGHSRVTGMDAFEDLGGVVVADAATRKVFEVARRLSQTATTVLIHGETGAGKEILASTIHRWSARAKGPFVRLNCGALPETLLESELFGHEKGAFTGAEKPRAGYFEAAHKGTILLDEIGDMPLETQVKLLWVLENRKVIRVGGTREVPVDVRVLSATHRDLRAEVQAGRFREDLYYRISTFTLEIPPLRQRPLEVALLADLFAREVAQPLGIANVHITAATRDVLARYAWPGNVRELRNVMEHAVILSDDGAILPEHLPNYVLDPGFAPTGGALRDELSGREKQRIEAALAAESGNQTRAAQRLGISRRALIYKLHKYGLMRSER